VDNYGLTVDEAMRAGLKPDSRIPHGIQFLDVCTGLRPTQFGLKDYITITQPMTDEYLTGGGFLNETKAWPCPQIIRGSAITLLCFSDAIYEIDESDWSATLIELYDAADFGDSVPGDGSITADGPWHFMDFHDTWVLMNGTTTIWKTGYYSRPIATDAVTIKTGCDMKGRAIMGGFDPANFYALADWPEYWEGLTDNNTPSEILEKVNAMAGGAGTNWCWWSTIGGGDLLWLVSRGLYLSDNKPLIEHVSNGTFTGNANGWTLGAGWAYGTNNVVATNASGNLTQLNNNLASPFSRGCNYAVAFTVSGFSGGSVLPRIGSVGGTAITADGTYNQNIECAITGSSLIFDGTGFTGVIDSVSVKLINDGAYGGLQSPWREIMQRNEFGMCALPWQGTVLHQRRLGDTVIAYGDGGISALVPHSSPVATFGVRDIQGLGHGIGIASRSAVGGSIDGHVFVDTSGALWRVTTSLQAERLGYDEYLADLLDDDIVISHDPQRNEFYIAGTVDSEPICYVLTETGFGKAPWVPTNVCFTAGGLVSILMGSTAAGVEVVTNKFGARRRKDIDQITLVTLVTRDTDASGWTVAIDYRFDNGNDWVRTAPVAVGPRGSLRVNVSGLEFRVVAAHPDRTKCDLEAIEVDMMRGGRRSLSTIAP
jgi:hypothetical protein